MVPKTCSQIASLEATEFRHLTLQNLPDIVPVYCLRLVKSSHLNCPIPVLSMQASHSAYTRTSPPPTSEQALRTYSSLMASHEFLPLVPSHAPHSPIELSHDITLSATSFTLHHPLSDSPGTVTAAHCSSCPEPCSHFNPCSMASQDSLQTRLSHETLLSVSSSLPYISTSQSLGPARSGHHSSSLSQENVPPSLLHSSHSPLRQCSANMGASPMHSLTVGPLERREDLALLKGDRAEGPRILKKVHIPGTGWTLQVSDDADQQVLKQDTHITIKITDVKIHFSPFSSRCRANNSD